MRESLFETLIGALVVAVAGVFLWFAIGQGTDVKASGDQYQVTARFNNISGVSRGTDVRIAGVKAGIVKAVEGDPKRFEAVVTLSVDDKWDLPEDTDARVSTDGLLGGSYVALEPGGSFDNIAKDGSGEIIYTRGSVDLLTLFASFASGNGGDDSGDSDAAASGASAAKPASDASGAGDDSYPDEDYQ